MQVMVILFFANFVADVETRFKSTFKVFREKVKFEARKVLQFSSELTLTVAILVVPSSEVICTEAVVGSRLILYKHRA